jgi:hypothetical protein
MANIVLSNPDLIKILDPGSVTTRASFSKARKPWTPGYAAQTALSAQARLVGVNLPGTNDITKTAKLSATGSEVTSITAGTTNASVTVTYAAATASFPVVGQVVSGTGITLGTTVATVTPGTGFTLSANATATNASAALSIVSAFTLPTGVGFTLPTTSDITDASNYSNAFLLAYAPGDRSNAVLVPRVGNTGANIAGPFWRVESSTTFSVVASGSAGTFVGYPINTVLELVVPASTDITVLINNTATNPGTVRVYDFLVSGATSNTGVITLNRIFK